VRRHAKVLTAPNVTLATSVQRMQGLYGSAGIAVQHVSTENLRLPTLNDVDVGQCLSGQTTAEQNQLFGNRNNVGADDVAVYFVRSTVRPVSGCAAHSSGRPARWSLRGRRSEPWRTRSATCSIFNTLTTMTG
jgi:hypothetical protein